MAKRCKITETEAVTELLDEKRIRGGETELIDKLLDCNDIIWGDYAICERRTR